MGNEFKTEKYIVAFIDVLGAKEFMKEDSDGILNKVHNVYTESIKLYTKYYGKISDEVNIRIFSDNIVVYCRCGKINNLTALKITTMLSAIIQVNFLKYDILVRGGISKGDFFADEVMIWGNALSNAYILESEVAVYPRIVIDNSLSEIFPECGIDELKKLFITFDNDYLYFVDYYSMMSFLKGEHLYKIILGHKAADTAAEYYSKMKIYQKWAWHDRFMGEGLSNEINKSIDSIEDSKECET